MRRFDPNILLGILAAGFALFAAQPYADSYNDGSRLATVQALAEQGTFAIDDTIFVRSANDNPPKPNPYTNGIPALIEHGTLDKVFIRGKFYSDKPPLPNLLIAGAYRIWLFAGGPTASERPDVFCYWCTVLSAGGPFVMGVLGVSLLMRTLGLSIFWQLSMALSFGFATVAAIYTRHVNGHIQLMGFASVICWLLARLSPSPLAGEGLGVRGLFVLGCVTGAAYTIELGIGPLLLGGVVLYVLLATRRWRPTLLTFVASLPFVVLHHAINYAIGNTLVPLGSVMEYLDYPGSAFGPENATGNWKHATAEDFFEYGGGLLFGDCGFILFQPTLWIALLAAPFLFFIRGSKQRLSLAFACGWPMLSWLLYTATSNNYSGYCCTIRWFIPLLAPAYWILGILIRRAPSFRWETLTLSALGAWVVLGLFDDGPWCYTSVQDFWWKLAVGTAATLAIRPIRRLVHLIAR
jgi:hypothetical protein